MDNHLLPAAGAGILVSLIIGVAFPEMGMPYQALISFGTFGLYLFIAWKDKW